MCYYRDASRKLTVSKAPENRLSQKEELTLLQPPFFPTTLGQISLRECMFYPFTTLLPFFGHIMPIATEDSSRYPNQNTSAKKNLPAIPSKWNKSSWLTFKSQPFHFFTETEVYPYIKWWLFFYRFTYTHEIWQLEPEKWWEWKTILSFF